MLIKPSPDQQNKHSENSRGISLDLCIPWLQVRVWDWVCVEPAELNYGTVLGVLLANIRSDIVPPNSPCSTIRRNSNLVSRESPRRELTPVVVPRREFHSGTKSRNGIM